MKKIVYTLLLCLFTWQIFPQINSDIKVDSKEHMEWWTQSRFGMFIHWGLYALPARHEWVMSNEKMSKKTYENYAQYFDPDLYNPTEWAKLAKKA